MVGEHTGDLETLLTCTPSDDIAVDEARLVAVEEPPLQEHQASVNIAWRGSSASDSASDLKAAGREVLTLLSHPGARNTTIAFGYANNAAVGVYIGSMLLDPSANTGVLQSFLDQWHRGDLDTTGSLMQVCGDDRPTAYKLGIVADANPDPEAVSAAVQQVVATWNSGQCVIDYGGTRTSKATLSEVVKPDGNTNARRGISQQSRSIEARQTCRTIKVHSGNGCYALSQRCGITPAQFTKYKPSSTLFSTLVPGQHVCCSAGKLPDFSPEPNADGTCATYPVQSGDTCAQIAAAHSITTEQLKNYTERTCGWAGCRNLMPHQVLCLSKGESPMPAVIPNAVCGPQVEGTERPDDWDDIESLNPCPLNACCDKWG